MKGRRIHTYEIVSHLGEGGMGTVYKASDTALGRPVALKMLHASLLQQSQFLERFQKEARLLAQLLHPNIAVIYNLIEQEGQQYMVMEYVEGNNLEALLQQGGTLPYEVVVPVFMQALEGLHHAHRKGIYHRDIKPSNLILTPDGTVKLMDFGIAMMAGEQRLTQVNRMVGTLGYMAPELIEGKPPSVASDLYAIGVTMYELLTGKLPFTDPTDYQLMQNILKQKPMAPDKLNGALPKALSGILLRALEKNPANRFADAQEMKAALSKAFPSLVFANISEGALQQRAVAPQTRIIATTPARSSSTPAETKLLSAPSSLLSNWQQLLTPKRIRVGVAALVLLLLIGAAIAFWQSPNTGTMPTAAAQNGSDTNAVNQSSSTTTQYNRNDQMIPLPQPLPQPLPLPPDADNTDKESEKKKEEKKNTPATETKTRDKQQPSPEEKKETPKPVVETPVTVVTPPKVEETKRPARTLNLTYGPDVKLYLTTVLDAASVKARQQLTFRVTREVRYEGTVIIEQGATATGYVKNAGSKKISVVVNAVTAVNGQTLPVQEEELSGRIDDMVANRDYIVNLKKGIQIHL